MTRRQRRIFSFSQGETWQRGLRSEGVTSIQDVGQPSRASALACVKQLREGVKVENNLNLRNLRKTCGQREPDFGSIISVTPAAPSLKDKTVLPSCEIYVVLTNRINDPPLIWSDAGAFALCSFHFQSMTDGFAIGDGDKSRGRG